CFASVEMGKTVRLSLVSHHGTKGVVPMSHTERANYPTDLTDEQWQILCKLLPRPSRRGAPQTVCRRAVVNAILYVLRTGCTWRFLPHDFPKWKTIYGIFLGWRNDGTWQRIHDALRDKL